jgi:phosphoenolpyruvate-protein kinase (PTS system EI component)
MRMAIEDGRTTRPELEVGICGEHGGDPESIEWCHIIGNNYVSCSPFRVPIARLAAAHVALKYNANGRGAGQTAKKKTRAIAKGKSKAKRARPKAGKGK